MKQKRLINRVLILMVAFAAAGCNKSEKSKKSDNGSSNVVPSIEVIAGKLGEYSTESSAEVKERVGFIQDFVKRMHDEGLGNSRPVELSRTTNGDSTVIRAVWERTYTLVPDASQSGNGVVAVTVQSGESRTQMLLGLNVGGKIDPTFTAAALNDALKDPVKVNAVSLVQAAGNNFSPADSLSHVYQLASVEEKLFVDVAPDGKSAILRARTRPVELKFTSEGGNLKLLSCDFAAS